MSGWRRRALESFPDLRPQLNAPVELHLINSPYVLWHVLLPMALTAHRDGDEELLDRIYRYGDWCFQQRSEDLWNSVAVCFYEHLVDHPGHWESVLSRLSDRTIRDVWGLWEAQLGEAKIKALGKLLEKQRRPVPSR